MEGIDCSPESETPTWEIKNGTYIQIHTYKYYSEHHTIDIFYFVSVRQFGQVD